MADKNACLSDTDAFSATGCGAGTPNACFALVAGPGCNTKMQCGMISNPAVAQMAGIQLGGRVNVDPTDHKAWCPLGVLDNSKTA